MEQAKNGKNGPGHDARQESRRVDIGTGGDSMTDHDPIDLLKKEHRDSLRRMGLMQQAAVSIRDSGFSAKSFREIAESILFLGKDIRRHNDKEERYLFPLLDRHVMGATSEVRHERRDFWRAVNDLSKFVRDVEDGRVHSTTIRELVQTTLFIVEHFRATVNKEDTVLFPMANRMFTPEEYAQMKVEINGASEPGGGERN